MTKPATTGTDNPDRITVPLETPIGRKGGDIAQLTLRKPKVTDLRDINLQSIVSADTASIMKLLPRISEPALIAQEVESMEISDFIEIAGTIAGFFMNPAQRAMVAELRARAAA